MAKKIINIRLDDDLWKQAKLDAVRQDVSLQDWLALAIIRLLDDNRRLSREFANQNSDDGELHIAGEGIKR